MALFQELKLNKEVLDAIEDLGYTTPSPIQQKAIPACVNGLDVIGQAQTGTGKTLAYAASILTVLAKKEVAGVGALIIAPTRELSIQIGEEFKRLGRYLHLRVAICHGGVDIRPQIKQLKSGANIVVGTPGRLNDLIMKKALDLSQLLQVVLDEADEMLDMGFLEEIEAILRKTPGKRQTMLFSATMPEGILNIAKKYMKSNATHIKDDQTQKTANTIEQFYFEVRPYERYEALCRLLDGFAVTSAIIFCQTKKGVDELTGRLIASGYPVAGMHGDLSQEARLETLRRFREGLLPYLVATDVAARGIDVKNISHVINYEMPTDSESYVHRIGRTGRANQYGQSLSLVTKYEKHMIHEIEQSQNTHIQLAKLPNLKTILSMQAEHVVDDIEEAINNGKHKTYLQDFYGMDRQELLNVASALFYLQSASHLGFDYKEDSIGYMRPVGKVILDLGPDFSISHGAVVKYLATTGHIAYEDLGKIEIEGRGVSVMVLTEEALEKAKKYLNNTKLAGRKVKAKVITQGSK